MLRRLALFSSLVLLACKSAPSPRPDEQPVAASERVALNAKQALALNFLEHPLRTPNLRDGGAHEDIELTTEDGLKLKGWLWKTTRQPVRGWVIYLHGRDSNRGNGVLAARALVDQGFNVLAYDHRAHGQSEGSICTYGVKEAEDAKLAIDHFTTGPVFLIGESLGAATALITAAQHRRVRGVIAAAPFSDMSIIVREVGTFASEEDVQRVLARFEQDSGVKVEDASPAKAARDIRAPVLLLRGNEDKMMSMEHIDRIRKNLTVENKFYRLDGADHPTVLTTDEVWSVIVTWIDQHAPAVSDEVRVQ